MNPLSYLLCADGMPLAIYSDDETAFRAVRSLPHFADELVCLVALPLNPALTIRHGQVVVDGQENAPEDAPSEARGVSGAVTLSSITTKFHGQSKGGA